MKIIVDTNIIFSAILNSNGTIGNILFNSNDFLEFHSCNYMRFEIDKHWKKLIKISKLSEAELKESHYNVLSKIQFINEELIPSKIWLQAETLIDDIDIDDVDFVALTKYLKGYLWTGDKELYVGLKSKNFKRIYNTTELAELRDKLLKK